jgi:2-polyprenyl-3-methyl-5-hydroxy-6-metoxy-1,4-benzoquinol methylase
LGCSTGYLSGYLEKEKGCEVTGVDIDPNAVAVASKRCHASYAIDLDRADALDNVGDSFDVLLAPAVLEHLKYPERLLTAARKLLRPQATVIVSLPNIAHWSSRVRLLIGQFDYTDYGLMDRTHLHFYTLRTGRALLENCGYCVKEHYIIGSLVQNSLNVVAKRFNRTVKYPIWPGLLAYELIYVGSPVVLN